MNITLRQLRYLVALSETGHFGRAAELCKVSQPALSVQIRELEESLGRRIVERHTREVRITPLGREVVARAEAIFGEISEIEQRVRWEGGLQGRLSVGLIPTVAPYLLPLALPRLRTTDIMLELGIVEAKTQELMEELRAGRIDAAVVALPAEADDVVSEPLFDDRFVLAASRGRADLLAPEALRPEAIAPEQLLLLDEGHCLSDQALSFCGIGRRALRTDLRAASLATLTRLVESGFGMTLLPELSLWAETASAPGLVLRRFAEPEPARRIGLVRRAVSVDDGWFRDLAQVLRAAAQEALARAPARIAERDLPAGWGQSPGDGV